MPNQEVDTQDKLDGKNTSVMLNSDMSSGLKRPKQPDLVRAELLHACVQLLADGGPVSIGAVADLAGVTKGAVQHHFGTRESLFSALFEALLTDFRDAVEEQGDDGLAAWRYSRVTLERLSGASNEEWRAMLVASVTERAIAAKWARWATRDRKRDGDSIPKLVARLASDGLWLSDRLGTYKLRPSERKALGAFIAQLSADQAHA